MRIQILTVTLILVLISGCTSLWMGPGYEKTREGASSSLVDFLYPNGERPPAVDERLPYLNLPLRVGIAFVPSPNSEDISAAEKQELMEHVADAFRDRDYVQSIDAIPDTYMRSARGVQGMRQVAALYGVDVMALVSYDQISFSGERDSALLYWTIVGALVVKGNTNEVQTMIDTAVFDVETAKLLFRAPGTHNDQRNATLMDNKQDLRKLRSAGFVAATDDMIVNLDKELEGFREEVESGQRAQVEWRPGSGGGGGFALPLIALLFLVGIGRNVGCWRS
ncbi:MAG: rhombotarget lipoprotein [Gammaproteobacteria bacterium]|nr:rhombotarget lipoprotein [Gammaproteobacteria bacterium]MDH3372704.1 rhombotarget lipoprotein [Gammaproteobacteria bacterium]MDH3409735.1 rhombotarget lipoprotein [Gammaproteobacteria bacterium]MDH3551715.1 rhombotarget lipoprotein [Gammaproteobacteria bacterium]